MHMYPFTFCEHKHNPEETSSLKLYNTEDQTIQLYSITWYCCLNSRPFLSVAGIHTLKKLWSKNSWKDSLFTGFAHSSLVHISTESGRKLNSRGLENGRDVLLFMH